MQMTAFISAVFAILFFQLHYSHYFITKVSNKTIWNIKVKYTVSIKKNYQITFP